MRLSLRPAGEKVAWAQPMTDEGDHGGAYVVGRAAEDSGPYGSHRKSV